MALALVARALTRPGDAIAVEHPGYRPAWEAFRIAGAEIVPLRVDEHGVDVQALQRVIARRSIRAVYVTPHHQYPTTVTLTVARRLALLQLAAQERFAIIEDDYDHEFHYSGRPVLPLASADAAGLVIYIGTLSKVLAPGLRLGFIVAPGDLIERLVAYRSFVDLQGDPVLESAVAELFEEGLIQRHVRKMRRIYRARLRDIGRGTPDTAGTLRDVPETRRRNGHLGSSARCSDDDTLGPCGARGGSGVRCRRGLHDERDRHLECTARFCLSERS